MRTETSLPFWVKTSLIALSLSLTGVQAAQAQIRVDSRLYTSSGSCSNCDLSGRTMTGMTLRNSNFSGSQFNNSNLSGGKFDSSDLSGTQFRRAFLARVEGKNVNMASSSFQDATLAEANLSSSVMTGADMRRADLSRGHFTQSNFKDADLTSALATEANFKGSDFNSARFDHMNLRGATLDDARFHNVKFGNAKLLNASLNGADFSDADLSATQGLTQAQLDTACGNMNTRLPVALSIPYCESVQMNAHRSVDHAALNPKLKRATARLDNAIGQIEMMLSETPKSDRQQIRRLQNIHAELVSSRRAIAAQ